MKVKAYLLVLSMTFNVIASPYYSEPVDPSTKWHAHESKNISEETMLKKNLSFILTQNRSAAGLAFISLEEKSAIEVYANFKMNTDYKIRIGETHFRSFDAFSRKMEGMANEIPHGEFIYDASVEALIKTAYYFKRMKADMSSKMYSFETSFSNIQAADYAKKSRAYHDKALKICSGEFKGLNFVVDTLPTFLVNAIAKAFTGKNCEGTVKKDVLAIIYPYDNPLTSNENHSTLEGTSIFLAEKLIPNREYESNLLFQALLNLSEIESIDPDLNLHDAIKSYLGLSSLETIRLINLANHNHGLEFFMTNAIIDLSSDVDTALTNAKAAYSSLNHLYDLINKHQQERKKISKVPEDQYGRPYHYWAGVMMTCELMQRGYNKYVASYVSSKLGEAYEVNSSDTTIESERRGMMNDIELHSRGAKYGQSICN